MSLFARTKVKQPVTISATYSIVSVGVFVAKVGWTRATSAWPNSYDVIYKNGEELATDLLVTNYRDTSVSQGESLSYAVSTVNVNEIESVARASAAVRIPSYPVWQTGWSLSIDQSNTASIASRASDPDGDALTFSKVGGTVPGTVTVSSAGVVTVGSTSGGSYSLILRASDGVLSADTTVTLTVNEVVTVPNPPINFSANPASSTELDLTWQAPASGPPPTDYDLDFSLIGASGPWTPITIGLVLVYQHTGLSESQQVWYRLLSKSGVTPAATYATATATTFAAGTGTNPWITQGAAGYLPVIRNGRGSGMDTPGGSGRAAGQGNNPNIYYVNSLSNANTGDVGTGRGTIRWCVGRHNTVGGPSFIGFETSGTINLGGAVLRIDQPYLHVAFHTAPNPGIQTVNGFIRVTASHVVIQHYCARYREGVADADDTFMIGAIGGANITGNVVDHGTFLWGRDESIDMTQPRMQGVTFSNCIMGEGIEGGTSFNTISIRGTDNCTFFGNLLINARERNPLCRATNSAWVNNVYYNWSNACFQFLNDTGIALHSSIAGGAFVRGPNDAGEAPVKAGGTPPVGGSNLYLAGNKVWSGNTDLNTGQTQAAQFAALGNGGMAQSATPPYWPTGLIADTADNARLIIRTFVGARPANRDLDVTRLINEYINNTGSIKSLATTANPTYAVNTRALSAPGPGLAASGYTNLEEWSFAYEDQVLP
jgi:hypothetical protein